jgi:hypothetical protein
MTDQRKVVKVPDLPRPVVERAGAYVVLCWKQDPNTFWRCTKKAGHPESERHSWELVAPPE